MLKNNLRLIIFLSLILIGGGWLIYQISSASNIESKGEIAMGNPSSDEQVYYSEEEWKEKLTPEQYHIMREKGTERAFTGKYNKYKEKGIYLCAGCGLPLYSSEAKYDSGTGWPSFYEPINASNVAYKEDNYLVVMKRTEVVCNRCQSHLGHVFNDGPAPTGKRYCMNSSSLKFIPGSQKTDH